MRSMKKTTEFLRVRKHPLFRVLTPVLFSAAIITLFAAAQFPIYAAQTTVTTSLDSTPPPSGNGYYAETGTQLGGIVRNGLISACGNKKTLPFLADVVSGRRYDTYTYTAPAAGCVTVTLSASD